MKRAVSTKLPYGEWIKAQTATLQDIVDAAPQDKLTPPPILPELAHAANGNGSGAGKVNGARGLPYALTKHGRVNARTIKRIVL